MYYNRKNSLLKHWDFIILDILMLQVAYILAFMIRHGTDLPYQRDVYAHMAVVMVLMDLLIMFLTEAYKNIIKRGYFQELKAVAIHVSLLMLCLFAYMFVLKTSSELSRAVFLTMWVLAIGLLYGSRLLLKQYVRKRLRNLQDVRNVVLITSEENMSETMKAVRKNHYRDYRITAVALMDEALTEAHEIYGIPVYGKNTDILERLQRNVVDEVLINLPDEIPLPTEIVEDCVEMGITIHLALSKASKIGGNKVIEDFAGFTVMTSSLKIASTRQMVMKRMLDILGGIVGTLLTGILCIFIGPIIYLKSPGPIFFTQNRVGTNGRIFKIYKFRSMYMDAEERKKELMDQNEMDGLMFKMKDDPRIIKGIGNFIRKTSIDEFPQFFNVLKGDMSLVGTRPPTVEEYEQYEPRHKKRLAVKPGITGMWQVSGRSEINDFEHVVKLDAEYIEQWHLGLDVKILWQTVAVVVGHRGAV